MENHATAGAAVDECGVDQRSEEYRLLMAYCGKRKRQRSGTIAQFQGRIQNHGPTQSRHNATFLDTGSKQLKSHVAEAQGLKDMFEAQGLKECMSRHGPVAVNKKLKTVVVEKEATTKGDVSTPSVYTVTTARAAGRKGNTLNGVADRLTQISDSVQITTDDIEADGTEDQHDVIRRLVELLKSSGDELNEEIKRNHVLQRLLKTSFTYGLFETVTSTLLEGLTGVGGDVPVARAGYPAPERVQREQIALTCEVTSRLSALDLHPMSRVMGFGTRYLQEHHTAWVKKHGGWNKVFDSEDTD